MTTQDALHALASSALAYNSTQAAPRPHEHLTIIDDPATDVQCYIRQKGTQLFITFRGTNSNKDRITDLTFWKKAIPYENPSSKIRVHSGFINAYKCEKIRDRLHALLTPEIALVRVTGHSYGAALAVLCAVDLEYNFPYKDYEVFLFGCPRVGNAAFRRSYNKRVFQTLRFENGNDLITKIPFASWGYRHVGIPIHLGAPRIFGLFSPEAHRPQHYYAHFWEKFKP